MRFHSTIAFTAMAAALATPQAASARARAASSNSVEELRAAEQQIAELRAEVNDLKAMVRQQAVTQSQAAADAQAASAKADQALAQASVANTEAVAAKAEAHHPILPDSVKWAANASISGRMYFNISNIDQKSNGIPSTGNGTGFNIKRMYIGVDHKFDDRFSMNVTADISNVVGRTSNGNFVGSGGGDYQLVGRGLYVKKAYLQAKIDPALIVRLGSADMPWIPYIENQYGFRHIENTLIDRVGWGTSADWGIHVLGDLPGKVISYQVSVVNGAGYRNVKVSKSVDVEGRVSANLHNFYAAVGGYVGKRGNNVEGAVTHHTASRLDAAVGYKDKRFGLGAEYFHAKNWNNVTTIAEDSTDGWSMFGNFNFIPKWSVFGRYDWVKPSRDRNPALRDNYFNVGVQWEPVKIVDLALVYKRDGVDHGTLSTSNGMIGGSVQGTYDEVGLFGQVRF